MTFNQRADATGRCLVGVWVGCVWRRFKGRRLSDEARTPLVPRSAAGDRQLIVVNFFVLADFVLPSTRYSKMVRRTARLFCFCLNELFFRSRCTATLKGP